MASLNKVMIIGNLGSDPEMRFTPNGNPVTSFTVATNRVYNTSAGERKTETAPDEGYHRALGEQLRNDPRA